MTRALVTLLLCCAHLGYAAPRQVLVLRAEGNADATTRANIDAHVVRLAKSLDGKVEAGDISLTEAAAAVGCNPSDGACKDEVLATLGVDEIVATTVTTAPTGINVTVRRLSKGSAPRTAQSSIPAGKTPETKMNADIGPLFGAVAATSTPPAAEKTAPPPPTTTTPPAPTPSPTASTTATAPRTADASTEPMSQNAAVPATTTVPPQQDEHPSRLPKIGMGVGAGFLIIGFICWSQANGVQSDIDNAPTRSPADFRHLQDLENEADAYAGAGNLFVIVGALTAGVSTYFYIRGRRSSNTQTARVAPAVFPHGAGVTLTFGGAP